MRASASTSAPSASSPTSRRPSARAPPGQRRRAAACGAARPRAPVRLSAPMSFGQRHLGPLVSAFLARHPDVEVDLVLDDRFVDLLAEGFDVAVRIAELHDSSLVARRLCASTRVLCAGAAYLARHGTPPP